MAVNAKFQPRLNVSIVIRAMFVNNHCLGQDCYFNSPYNSTNMTDPIEAKSVVRIWR